MKRGFQDQSPKISLTVLGTLCFVTLVMCQTRFQITKEISQEIYPPVLRSKDYWFLYSIGNPDRFKCVLKAFILVTSPVLSFISTALLLFGKVESNPYFFIPWLFLTVKGLLLVQTDNIFSILRDMGNRSNYIFGLRLEDVKWLMFYGSIFMIDLIEAFSFLEIFDLFLVLWNHHPGYNAESATLEAVKREIADIMEALSRCSLGSMSKISLTSSVDSDDNVSSVKKLSKVKFSLKENDDSDSPGIFSKTDSTLKSLVEDLKNEMQNSSLYSVSELTPTNDTENLRKNQIGELDELYLMQSKLNTFSKSEVSEKTDFFPLES